MTVLLTSSVLSCDTPHGAHASAAKLEMLATSHTSSGLYLGMAATLKHLHNYTYTLHTVHSLVSPGSISVPYPYFSLGGADFDDTPILFEVDSNGDFRAGIPVTPDDIYEANQNFIVLLELANQSFADIVSIDRRAAVCRIVDDDCKYHKHKRFTI